MISNFLFGGLFYGFLFCTTNAPLHKNDNPDYILPAIGTEAALIGWQAVSGHKFEWQDVGAGNVGMGGTVLTLKITF